LFSDGEAGGAGREDGTAASALVLKRKRTDDDAAAF